VPSPRDEDYPPAGPGRKGDPVLVDFGDDVDGVPLLHRQAMHAVVDEGDWRVPAAFGCSKDEVLAQLRVPPLTAADVARLQAARAVLSGAGDSPMYACASCTCSGLSNEARGNARLLSLDDVRSFMIKPCPAAWMPLTDAAAAVHAHLAPHVQPAYPASALPLSVYSAPVLVVEGGVG